MKHGNLEIEELSTVDDTDEQRAQTNTMRNRKKDHLTVQAANANVSHSQMLSPMHGASQILSPMHGERERERGSSQIFSPTHGERERGSSQLFSSGGYYSSECEEEDDDPLTEQQKLRKDNVGSAAVGVLTFLSVSLAIVVDFVNLSTFSSIAVAMLALTALGVSLPLTYLVFWRQKHTISPYQPFVGGARYATLQTLGWTLWTVLVLLGCVVLAYGTKQVWRGLMSSLGVGGVLAQIAVLTSIHYFESTVAARAERNKVREKPKKENSEGEPVGARRKKRRPSVSTPISAWTWQRIGSVGVVLTSLSLILAIVIAHVPMPKLLSMCLGTLATAATLLAIPWTHGFAGRQKDENYKFIQPFVGGRMFVFLQTAAWSVWFLTLVLAIVAAVLISLNLRHSFLSITITTAGVGGVVSQALLMLSIRYFDAQLSTTLCASIRRRRPSDGGRLAMQIKSPSATIASPKPAAVIPPLSSVAPVPAWKAPKFLEGLSWSQWKEIVDAVRTRAWWRNLFEAQRDLVIVSFFYLLPLITVIICIAPVPLAVVVPYGWIPVVIVTALYSRTYRGSPHTSGKRAWPEFRYNVALWESFERYFYLRLVPHGTLDPKQQYLFGFHPHGIFPTSSVWATRGRQWNQYYPGVDVEVLGSSVMFQFPCLRDALMWCGVRDVSRKSIESVIQRATPTPTAATQGTANTNNTNTNNNNNNTNTDLVNDRHTAIVDKQDVQTQPSSSSNSRKGNKNHRNNGSKQGAEGEREGGLKAMESTLPLPNEQTLREELRAEQKEEREEEAAAEEAQKSRSAHAHPQGSDSQSQASDQHGSQAHLPNVTTTAHHHHHHHHRTKSVMLIPGGVREMQKSRGDRDIHIVIRHQGFVRMALTLGVPLVPVLSFGEDQLIENIRWPSMQTWTAKYLGFGFPMYPFGRWYSPLPNRAPLTIIVGDPISTAEYQGEVTANGGHPSPELVNRVHGQYYDSLQRLFEQYKGQVEGFESASLITWDH